MTQRFFINRRTGEPRRRGAEQRQNPRLDLSHRRRRKQRDRRHADRNMSDHFYAAKGLITSKGAGVRIHDKH